MALPPLVECFGGPRDGEMAAFAGVELHIPLRHADGAYGLTLPGPISPLVTPRVGVYKLHRMEKGRPVGDPLNFPGVPAYPVAYLWHGEE